jgi:hypothetical protein
MYLYSSSHVPNAVLSISRYTKNDSLYELYFLLFIFSILLINLLPAAARGQRPLRYPRALPIQPCRLPSIESYVDKPAIEPLLPAIMPQQALNL